MRHIIFFGLLAIISIVFVFLIRPFFFPIFWAAIIASLFYPVHRAILDKLKRANLSSILTLLIALLVIIIPLSLISSLIVREAFDLYTAIRDNQSSINNTIQNVVSWLRDNPLTQKLDIDPALITERVSQLVAFISNFIFNALKSLTQSSLEFIVLFVIMLYTLFFFLRDGEKMLKKAMHLCPLGDKQEIKLYEKFTATAKATLKGTLIIALIQGALGSIMFLLLGIQGALIWGIIMALFSVIPGFGSYVVWLPAAIIMFILGNVWQGVVIILFGALVISTVDNFLRPFLVSKGAQMHPLIILFSTLGGIIMFGISGFILGPIIAAFLLSLWEMYEQYYREGLDNN